MGSPEADPRAVLAAWGIEAILGIRTPATGTINQTMIVATPDGERVLRAYRHRARATIAREHAIIAHVRERGLPAVGPLPLPDGGTILAREGRYYALFPLAAGRQIGKGKLGAVEAAAMGRFLARLHAALASLPLSATKRRDFVFDRDAALAGIARLEATIAARGEQDAADAMALAWLAGQRDWLLRLPEGESPDLAALPFQVIHGDYQEANLFFAGGAVSAIIDWDQTYAAPRAWEVARALDLALGFAPAPSAVFIAAYREVLPLPLADLDRALAVYARKVGHDLWLYESYYLEGNERLARFFQPGGFVSPEEGWARLRPLVGD